MKNKKFSNKYAIFNKICTLDQLRHAELVFNS